MYLVRLVKGEIDMSNNKPHIIMGQIVQGTPSSGYTVEVKKYKSTIDSAYRPAAKDMLAELQNDVSRLQRVLDAKSQKISNKLENEGIS